MAASASPIAPSTASSPRSWRSRSTCRSSSPCARATRSCRAARASADDFAWGRERFLDEARALARFRHPHIVPVLRFLTANGTAYTVMEFEDGRSLGRDARPLRPPPAARRSAAARRRRAARPRRGACAGLPASRHQAVQHHHPPRRRADPDRLRRGAAGDGRPHAHAHLGADAAVCADRAVHRRGQAGAVERHLLGRRGAASRHRRRAAAGSGGPHRQGSPTGRSPTAARSFDKAFLAAVDSALAFAPEQRPQSVAEWSKLFGLLAAARARCADPAHGPAGRGRRRVWAASAARCARAAGAASTADAESTQRDAVDPARAAAGDRRHGVALSGARCAIW